MYTLDTMTDKFYIHGKHAVLQAVINRKDAVLGVFVIKEFDDKEILLKLKENAVSVVFLSKIPREVESDAIHQGIFAQINSSKLMIDFDDYIKDLEITKSTSLVVLDEIQDPQNVGAIIRSAVAFGASGVLIPEHNQAQVNGTVVKVSAGGAFNIPLVSIKNINNTLRTLKDKSFWIYGLEGEGKNIIGSENFDSPAVFVMGNEANGIRLKTKEVCDVLLKIPIDSKCESLNVATSASIALYVWSVNSKKNL